MRTLIILACAAAIAATSGCRVLRRLGVSGGDDAAATAGPGADADDAVDRPYVKRPPTTADYQALAASIFDGIAALEITHLPMTQFAVPANRDARGVDYAARHEAEGLTLEIFVWMGDWPGDDEDVLPRTFGDLSIAIRAEGEHAHAVRMSILEQLDNHWNRFWATYDLRGA